MGKTVSALIEKMLAAVPSKDRAALLRLMMRHTAAAMISVQGATQASEDIYRLADETVVKGKVQP